MLFQLIDALELQSATIKGLNLKTKLTDRRLDGSMRSLPNNNGAIKSIGDGIEYLCTKGGVTPKEAEEILTNILDARNFYGAYCELGAYDWLAKNNVDFAAQVNLTSADVLNPNGCTIDGKISIFPCYFDIKGFGMQAYLMDVLKGRLEDSLPGNRVAISGPLDVGIKDIENFAFGSLNRIELDLSKDKISKINELGWDVKIENGRGVFLSEHSISDYRFASNNKYYCFKTARQFARNEPFILVFPYSEIFNNLLSANVFKSTDTTLRALARRTFIEMASDGGDLQSYDKKTPPGTTVSEASKLISALLFINLDNSDGWLFLNPRAIHKLTQYHVEQIFDFHVPITLGVEDFLDDDY